MNESKSEISFGYPFELFRLLYWCWGCFGLIHVDFYTWTEGSVDDEVTCWVELFEGEILESSGGIL
jgi:hypothetical protein